MCSSSGMYVAFWRNVCSSLVSHPGSNPGILPNIVLYIKWKLRMESGPSLTLVALYKRVTQAKCSCCSLKKSDMSDSLFCSKKQAIRAWKKCIFLHVFLPFSTAFPFYAKERIVPIGLCSIVLFLKSDGSDSLLSLFTKEWPWVKRSPRSYELLFRSLAHKKQVIHSKTQRANYQPCFIESLYAEPFTVYPGLGTPFFSVQNVTFFCVLKRECYVLFCSFL